ncbi:glycosyltransferase [Natronoglycomyces albus]|uniref:D-inositol-3-phosphate glycosyltransferase n=1 Tax=Natronoglycomyces albus TaxID=2811108 RepID=A0A895XUG6_9ACTN|nr:glycosyltransferase [Natronoglycomyces albus]
MLSMHTSPLAQPGTGDAGGMNVYIDQTAKQLVSRGVEVEVFTRATSSSEPQSVVTDHGVVVHHVPAGPFEGLSKHDLPGQLCAFAAGILRTEAHRPEGYFDLLHSHYWLSGQAGWIVADRWNVPLLHTFHTLAKVKNDNLAAGDTPEPLGRIIGEEQVVGASDRLIANTPAEARDLYQYYEAPTDAIDVVSPGVDLGIFRPVTGSGEPEISTNDPLAATVHGRPSDRAPSISSPALSKAAARAQLGLDPQDLVVAFVGRIQPAKAPDVLLHGFSRLRERHPELSGRLKALFVGGPSNSHANWLPDLITAHGLDECVQQLPPRTGNDLANLYRAADVVAFPSHNESFGLVALEAQACGTPVIASNVGGLATVVDDQRTGTLVNGHAADDWAAALHQLLTDADLRHKYGREASAHAQHYSWSSTAEGLLHSYVRARQAARALVACS